MTYQVEYKMHSTAEVKRACVWATSKIDAYDKAVYVVIPQREGEAPYSAWVESVVYRNGSEKRFDTFEGRPY